MIGDERSREALWRELRGINESLVSKIPTYESKHNEPFLHDGHVYIETMHRDIPQLTKYAEAITAQQGAARFSPMGSSSWIAPDVMTWASSRR